MEPYTERRGSAPLLISVPHAGTHVSGALEERFTDAARSLPDTDWFVDRLYDFADALDATVIVATHSRYVVDLNRPPDDASLYPGQTTTGLVPLTTFEGEAIYRPGAEPDDDEREARRGQYWRPYHAVLAAELARLEIRHGAVLLWDAHSIASEMPRLFEGTLPHFNVGTAGGRSCSPEVERAVASAAARHDGFSLVVNGRFQGGHITRGYGEPGRGVHAVQLELAQRAYMDEATGAFDESRAAAVRPALESMIRAAVDALPTR